MLRLVRGVCITRSGDAPGESARNPAKRSPMATSDLRPLGLGEILDRAVTLFVRHFGVLVTALAVAYVPFALVQWVLVGWLIARKPASRLTGDQWASFVVDIALGTLVFALTRTAVAAIAGEAYLSRKLSLGAAYRLAAQRFGAQIVTAIFATLIGFAILFVAAIPVVVTAIVATAGGGPGTVPILIALGIAGVVAFAPCAWLFFAYELATVRIATAAPNRYAALFTALRVTALRRPWRSLLAAVTLLFIGIAGSLIVSGLSELTPSPNLRLLMTLGVGSLGSVMLEAVTVTFLVAYDVDLAIRQEGLDLAVALDAP